MPKELWEKCLYELSIDREGQCLEYSQVPADDLPLRLGYALSDAKECTLFLEWRPETNDCPLLLSPQSVSSENTAFIKEIGQFYKGQKVLLLSLPRLAFLPHHPGWEPSAKPVDSFSNLGGLLRSREWHFRPPQIAFHISETDVRQEDGFLMALDFGTSASILSIVNYDGNPDESQDLFLRDLCPWEHETLVPDLSNMKSEREASWEVIRWEEGNDSTEKRSLNLPPDMLRNRFPLPRRGTPWIPSLFCKVRGYEGQDKIVIGDEALLILEASRHTASERVLHTFVFSPKKSLGLNDDPQSDEDIENYLFALFEMTAHRLSILDGCGKGFRGPLKSLSWSYPVVWLKHQVKKYEECLKKALARSALRNYVANWRPEAILQSRYALDEASAAFVGFLARRFNKMPPVDILSLMGPYRTENDEGDRMERNVLALDFGAGTTDIVWLTLKHETKMGPIVESDIQLYFALDQGGLEITRRIAEILKDRIREHNVNSGMSQEQASHWLRTNLNDPRIDETFLDGDQKQILSRYRRSKISEFFDIAEAAKRHLGENPSFSIDWTPLLSGTPLKAPGDSESLLTQDQLKDIVKKVFRPVFERIAAWSRAKPELDLILVSGRSSALLGLRELLEESIPREKAPVKNDFIWPLEYSFDDRPEDSAKGYLETPAGEQDLQKNMRMEMEAKTVVAEGLLENARKSITFQGNYIRCNPLDTMRRSRCIGILATDDGDRWLPRFRNDFNLLVEADYGNINPEEELPTYVEETNFTSEGKGLYLGINFAGKGNADIIDRPQVFARILLKNAEGTPYRSLKMFFRQKSATELCFNRALLTKENGDTVESVSTHQEGNRLTVENVTAEIRFFSDEKDFRNSGKIHIDGSHPIDRDPGFLL
ncbi:hypothetical protein [Fretibacterium fastidiosum]|uniref:hypothetical protein n=1 Tax=Fretibacterium fastidiosum TaxID=651822 RepID=UPI001AD837D3|nr:hypothetical protein [Fretibacterium fastidiosum]